MALYSDDSIHELIGSAGLLDMRNAEVVRAEIDTINRAENTASITLLDVCESVGELDLANVPFWYHCEKTVGTLEDLERGHAAFKAGDMVFAVRFPEIGEVVDRFFIVGHVGKRGTVKCVSDYIVVSMGASALDSATAFIVFDVSTSELLDLETFQNLDELSPAAPATWPASKTTYWDWLQYNFNAATPGATVPVTITAKTDPNYSELTVFDESNNWLDYPAHSDPYSSQESDKYPEDTGYLYNSSRSHALNSFQGFNASNSPTYATGSKTVEFGERYLDRGWDIVDGVTSATSSVNILTVEGTTLSGAMVHATGVATCNYSASLSVGVSSTIGTSSVSYASTDEADFSASVALGEVVVTSGAPFFDFPMWANRRRAATAVGLFGFYTVFCAPVLLRECSSFTFDFGLITTQGLTPEEWETFGMDPAYSTTGIKFNSVASVSAFSDVDGINLLTPVSPVACMQVSNSDKATSLANSIDALGEHVYAAYGWGVGGVGPTLSVYEKKDVATV